MNMAGIGSGINQGIQSLRGIEDLFLEPARLGLQGENLQLNRDQFDWQKALGERQFGLNQKMQMQDYLAKQRQLDWQKKFRNALLGIK